MHRPALRCPARCVLAVCSLERHRRTTQETLKHLTVSDQDEELYGGGGLYQVR